jgi:hypothetical protein
MMLMSECQLCGKDEMRGASKNKNWVCNACKRQLYTMDPARYLGHKLECSVRRRGGSELPTMDTVKRVIEQCHGQSVISGEDDVSRLCLIAVDPSKPLDAHNMALVTSAESYALSRTRTLEQRLNVIYGRRQSHL